MVEYMENYDSKLYDSVRTRTWAFIIYPESMPVNYLSILEENYAPFAVSPLHDKDYNSNGEPKKPHYHILFTFDGVKSYSQVVKISKSVNGVFPIPVNSTRGYYRYFCHLDNPEKFQYKECDIRCYMGFDSDLYSKPNSLARYMAIKDMMDFIIKNKVTEYYFFLDYCRLNRFDDWFKLLCDNSSLIISEFIKSMRNYRKDGHNDICFNPLLNNNL